jgi:hypothetical protein
MGFLDNKSRIIDFHLTTHGRKQLSKGKLDVIYYAFFDDCADYNIGEEDNVKLMCDESLSNSQYLCKRMMGTIDPHDSHVKPFVYISKHEITLRKQEQISEDLARLNLTDIVDVYESGYIELPQFDIEEPLYYTDDNNDVKPVPRDMVGDVVVDSDIIGSDFPDDVSIYIPDTVSLVNQKYHSVLSISDPEVVDLNLHGAFVKDGFKVEVYVSGTIDATSGSTNMIKLTEHGVDPKYKHYFDSDASGFGDIKNGYGSWFIITESE